MDIDKSYQEKFLTWCSDRGGAVLRYDQWLIEMIESAEAQRDELAAQLATVTEQVSTLAALVRLKYGNLDSDVNQILEECGHGWKS